MRSLAIGSRADEVLERFDEIGGIGAPVLLYESHRPGPPVLVTSFTGSWGGWAHAVGNGVPPRAWRRFRSALMEEEDKSAGFFTSFYLVENLEPLGSPRPLTELRGYGGDKPLATNFVPLGPVIVHW